MLCCSGEAPTIEGTLLTQSGLNDPSAQWYELRSVSVAGSVGTSGLVDSAKVNCCTLIPLRRFAVRVEPSLKRLSKIPAPAPMTVFSGSVAFAAPGAHATA